MITRRRAAVEAGLFAAFVSSIPGVAWVLATGEPWWRPVQLIATLVGVHDLASFDAVAFLAGGVIHLAFSVLSALVFAFVVGPRGTTRTIVLGALYGALIFACNFGATALVGLADDVRAGTNDAVELCAHLLYGSSMAWWLVWRLSSRSPRNAPAPRPRPPRGAGT